MMQIRFSSRSQYARPLGLPGKVLVSIFFLIFLLAGLFVGWMMLKPIVKSMQADQWPEVPCTVTREVLADRAPYAVSVDYTYTVQDRPYRANAIYPGYSASGDYYDAQKIADRFPTGSQKVCRVNPVDPSDAVLLTQSSWHVLQLLLPLIFIAVGIGGAILIWQPAPSDAPDVPRRQASPRGLAILCVMLLFGACLLIGFAVPMMQRYHSSQNWPRAGCTILHSDVGTHTSNSHGNTSNTYSINVLFQYTFDDRVHKSSRYSLVSSSSSGYAGKKQVVDDLNSHRQQFCYVNPTDPDDAVLNRNYTAVMVILSVAAVFAVLLATIVLRSAIRAARRA